MAMTEMNYMSGGGGSLTIETINQTTNITIDETGVPILNTSSANSLFVSGTVTRTGSTTVLPHLQLFYEDGTPASGDISGNKDTAVTVTRASNTGGHGKIILKKVSGDTTTYKYNLVIVHD